jgi:hypothetical protein
VQTPEEIRQTLLELADELHSEARHLEASARTLREESDRLRRAAATMQRPVQEPDGDRSGDVSLAGGITLAQLVRTKLDGGELPPEKPAKVVRTYGAGEPCSACDLPILPAQTKMEFETSSQEPVRLHFACWSFWLTALIRRGLATGSE